MIRKIMLIIIPRPINFRKTFKDTAPWANKYINFIGHTKGENFQIKAPRPVVPSKIAARVKKSRS